jgi:hypothetical protein
MNTATVTSIAEKDEVESESLKLRRAANTTKPSILSELTRSWSYVG